MQARVQVDVGQILTLLGCEDFSRATHAGHSIQLFVRAPIEEEARMNVRYWVCAVIRRRFPVGASPTRRTLQPEATGAAREVTRWLKPSDSVSRIGGSGSVQGATRVNAEQASKRTMRRPTRQPFRGRLRRLGD